MRNASRSVTRCLVMPMAVSLVSAFAARSAPPLVQSRTFDVRTFGAKGDGSTDDSAAFQSAIDAAQKAGVGSIVNVPKGNYMVASLILHSNCTIQGDGEDSILIAKGGADEKTRANFVLAVNPGHRGSANLAENEHDITIKNLTFAGGAGRFGFFEYKHIILINAASHVTLDHLVLRGYRGDGVYIGSGMEANLERHNKDILIQNCLFDGVNHQNRNGISVIDGSGVKILNNRFTRSGQPSQPGAIDLEPDNNFNVVAHVEIGNNTFDQNNGTGEVLCVFPGHSFNTQITDVQVHDNTFSSNSTTKYGVLILADPTTLQDGRALNFMISRNKFNAANTPINLVRAQGVEINANQFNGTLGVQLGLPNSTDVSWRSVLLVNNTFTATEDKLACVRITGGDGGQIVGNTFSSPTHSQCAVSINAPKGMDKFEVTNNTFISGPEQQFTVHFLTPSPKKPSWKIWGNKGDGVSGKLRSDI